MRYTLTILLLLSLGFCISGCQTASPTLNAAALTDEQQRVQQAMAEWPTVPESDAALKRPFFATIHIAGHRTTASGLLQYHDARDFRITAVTEMGVILFDGRMNWAGVTVLRSMPGVDKSIVETLLRDLATAFQLPSSLNGAATKNGLLIIKQTGADTNKYTWTFDARTGRLRDTDVDISLFDTLHIQYLRYTSVGWPAEITVTRKARLYTISLSFTDDAVARHDAFGSKP